MLRLSMLVLLTVCVFLDAAAQFPPRDLSQEAQDRLQRENERAAEAQRVRAENAPTEYVCWNGRRVLILNDCPRNPLEEQEAEAASAAPAEVPAAAPAAFSAEERAALEEQRRLMQLEADRFLAEKAAAEAASTARGTERLQRALAMRAEDRARLETGNCQAIKDESAALAAAVERARQVVDREPMNLFAAWDLADALSNAKQHEAALSELERAIALSVDRADRNIDIANLGRRAQLLANVGRLDEAFVDYERAGQRGEFASWTLQTRAAIANDDYATAIPHLEKLAAQSYAYRLQLAEAYWQAGRRADAIAKADQAIDWDMTTDVESGLLRIQVWHDQVERFCPAQ